VFPQNLRGQARWPRIRETKRGWCVSYKLRCFHAQAVIWFCTFAVALVIGCGGDTEKDTRAAAEPAATKAESDDSQKDLGKKKGRLAAMAKKRREMATAEYPEDLPVYPGANILSARTGKTGGGVSVTLESMDPAPEVAATLSSMLEKDGWFVQSTIRDDAHFVFADKGSRNLTVEVEVEVEVEPKGEDATIIRMLVFNLK